MLTRPGEAGPHVALIDAYLGAIGADPAEGPAYERYLRTGAQLHRRGERPGDVCACTEFLLSDPWYAARALAPTLERVRDTLPRWKKLGRPATVDVDAGRPKRGVDLVDDVLARQGLRVREGVREARR